MTDNGDGIWSVTLPLAPNATYQCKFRNQPSYGIDRFEEQDGLIAGGCGVEIIMIVLWMWLMLTSLCQWLDTAVAIMKRPLF